jgi:hypothetical protein
VVLCSYLFMCLHSVCARYTDILRLFQINATEIDIELVYRVLCGRAKYFKETRMSLELSEVYESCRSV